MGTKAHTNRGMVLVLACAAQFMVVLDVAIVNVALPSIQQDLGIGQNTLQWIIIAYGLMLGGFLLLGGRMADLLGRRRMLLTGLTLFSALTPWAIHPARSSPFAAGDSVLPDTPTQRIKKAVPNGHPSLSSAQERGHPCTGVRTLTLTGCQIHPKSLSELFLKTGRF